MSTCTLILYVIPWKKQPVIAVKLLFYVVFIYLQGVLHMIGCSYPSLVKITTLGLVDKTFIVITTHIG